MLRWLREGFAAPIVHQDIIDIAADQYAFHLTPNERQKLLGIVYAAGSKPVRDGGGTYRDRQIPLEYSAYNVRQEWQESLQFLFGGR